MHGNGKAISRKDLYKQVWAEPMRALAKQYGLSDVGLAKICKKHNIPRPPRGYWAKRQAGEAPEQPPLPRRPDKIIEIFPSSYNSLGSEEEAALAEVSSENEIDKPIIVPETLRKSHALVKESADIIKTCEPNHLGLLEPSEKHCLDIVVSKKSLKRALRIMDAVIKALEDRGHEVYLSKDGAAVKMHDVSFCFKISEEVESIKTQPEHHDLNGRYRFGHSQFDYKRVLSGRLCLTIHNTGFYWRGRRNWRDTKRQQLEYSLNSFMDGMLKIAIKKKVHIQREKEKERERQEWLRKREEEKRLHTEKLRMFQKEQERVTELIVNAQDWRKSKLIRKFVMAVQEDMVSGKCHYTFEGDFDDWVAWAHEQADRLDPLTPSPQSILDEEIEEPEKDRDDWRGFPFNSRY